MAWGTRLGQLAGGGRPHSPPPEHRPAGGSGATAGASDGTGLSDLGRHLKQVGTQVLRRAARLDRPAAPEPFAMTNTLSTTLPPKDESVHLLLIDPQKDFCEPMKGFPSPALPVPGANGDMRRIAGLIADSGLAIDRLGITLDTHSAIAIYHPSYWVGADGGDVPPMTQITTDDIANGRWRTRDPAQQGHAAVYVEQLGETPDHHVHMVWPEHCIQGSPGHAVHDAVQAAATDWARRRGGGDPGRNVQYLNKGLNPRVESYSALKAEVVDPADPATELNRAFIDSLAQERHLVVAGEAGSHCVRATVKDIVANLPRDGSAPATYLLTDCMSPVGAASFHAIQQGFLDEMEGQGVNLISSSQLRAAWGLEPAGQSTTRNAFQAVGKRVGALAARVKGLGAAS